MELPPSYFALPFLIQSTVWRILMRSFFNIFARFTIVGLENLQGYTRPVIFAPNHSSELDSVLLPLALPIWSRFAPLFYVVREQKFYDDPVFGWRSHLYAGWIFKMLGAYPIASGKKDYAVSLAHHVRIIKDGGSVCIFPEGGFSPEGRLGSAHGGVGYLALTTGTPVIPVLIEGTRGFSFKKLFTGKLSMRITFLAPLEPSVLFADLTTPSPEDMKQAGERILDKIRECISGSV